PDTGPQPGMAADDLLALLNLLGIDRVHLVATAAGAFAALDFAVSWPERLRGMVLANSIYGIQDPELLALTERLRPQPQFNQLPPDFRELGPAYRAAHPDGVRRWLAIEEDGRPPQPSPRQIYRNRLTLALMDTISLPV